jgi:hypothetical protein
MDGALRRNEGELYLIIINLFASHHPSDQMMEAQQAQDSKVPELVKAMERTYSIVKSTDELKSYSVLQDIMVQILKQTIECGYFIKGYARHNFVSKWQVY